VPRSKMSNPNNLMEAAQASCLDRTHLMSAPMQILAISVKTAGSSSYPEREVHTLHVPDRCDNIVVPKQLNQLHTGRRDYGLRARGA